MKTTINVTQEEIYGGVRGDCERCPIALAIQRCVPNVRTVSVCDSEIEIGLWGIPSMSVNDPPSEAVDFIRKFDNGLDVSPFSFEIET